MIGYRVLFFIEDHDIEGKFYVGDKDTFKPLIGDERVFTKEQIETLKKKPYTIVVDVAWARKPITN